MSDIGFSQQNSLNFRELLETAFLLRRRIFIFAAVLMAVGVLMAALARPNYVARSELIVLPSEEYTFKPIAGSTSLANEALSRKTMMASETGILTSSSLARAVIQRIGLKTLYPAMLHRPGLIARAHDAVHHLFTPHGGTGVKPDLVSMAVPIFEAHLTVLAAMQSDVISLSFAHPQAAVAKLVLRTLEQLYLQRRKKLFADDQSGAVAAQVSHLRRVLDQAETRLAAFQASHQVSRFHTREVILVKQQGSMEQDLMNAQSTIAQTAASLAALEHARRTLPAMIRMQQSTDMDQRTMALRGTLDGLRSKLATLNSLYQPDSPVVQVVRNQIRREAGLLARATGNASPSALQTVQNPVLAHVEISLVRDRTALMAARARATQDQVALAEIDDRQRALSGLKLKVSNLERQERVASTNYVAAAKILNERNLVEQVDAAKRASIRILSPATLPVVPFPLRKQIMLLAAILAAFGSILMVLVANFMRKGVFQAKALALHSGIPVLATVPELADAQIFLLDLKR